FVLVTLTSRRLELKLQFAFEASDTLIRELRTPNSSADDAGRMQGTSAGCLCMQARGCWMVCSLIWRRTQTASWKLSSIRNGDTACLAISCWIRGARNPFHNLCNETRKSA